MKNRRIQRLKRFLGIFTLTMGLCSCSGVNIMNKDYSIKRVRAENVNLNDTASFVSGEIYNSSTGRTLGARLEYTAENGVSFYPEKRESDEYSQVIFNTASNGSNYIYLTFDITSVIYNPYTPLSVSFNLYNNGILSAISNGALTFLNTTNNIRDDTYVMYLNSYNNVQEDFDVNIINDNNYGLDYTLNNYSTFINSAYFYDESTYYLTMRLDLNVSRTLVFTNGNRFDFIKNIDISTITNTLSKEYENGYADGYTNGQESGKAIGRQETIDNTYQGKTYQQIYNTGFSDGETTAGGSGALIPSLFGAIVNIPISVLNGLVPLTFFDISIIRVALTFLALGVVMWVIRKVMI